MKAIAEIIKVHCLMEHNQLGNFFPVYGAMTCDDFEYLEAVISGNDAELRWYFKKDSTALREEYSNVRKQSVPIKAAYDAFAEKVSSKLVSQIAAIRRPLASSRIVERTFTADGDRYFHFSLIDKWRNKLISFNPDNKIIKVVPLPDGYKLQSASRIMQIGHIIFEFIGGRRIKVNKLTPLIDETI